MPYLQLHDLQFPLFVGETRVGKGVGADVRLPGTEDDPTVIDAVVSLADDHSATLLRAGDVGVLLNGVELGAEPAPLLHGDRILVGDLELRFGDEFSGAHTSETPIPVDLIAAASRAAQPGRTGGRLVSLVDGREYRVPEAGLTLGRDAACDVVVAANEVSRRHARIAWTEAGYVLHDTSTNGLVLNGARVRDRALLGRGDIIRIGTEEFRFSADVYEEEPVTPAAVSLAAADAPVSALAPRPSGAIGEKPMPQPESAVAVASPERPKRPPLATLEILNEGPAKGTRISVTTPLAHVGRGAFNDIVVPDESVSEAHAKLQRRDTGWYVVDLDSTNGTYVGGTRVTGEAPLTGHVDVRFGGMKFLFRAAGSGEGRPSGTRVIVGLKAPDPQRLGEQHPAPRLKSAPPPDNVERIGVPRTLWITLVLLAILIVYFIVSSL